MKGRDIEKIAHYAELAWTLSGGKIVKDEMGDSHKKLKPFQRT